VPYPESPPLRGEIYWVDWSPGRGSEQLGLRPAVIISSDDRNRAMPTCVVAACTTAVRPLTRQGRSPVSLFLPAGQPMAREGCVLAFQVMTIDKTRLQDYDSALTAGQVTELKTKIRTSFDL